MKQTSILDENGTDVYTVLPNVKKGVPDDRKANIELYNEDNMTLMARYPDNYFDLAIVDPPYGIGADTHEGKKENGWKQYNSKGWDNATPTSEYWKELFRVSKNQIVWGGNYFTEYLPPKMGWIIWDKKQRDFSLSDAELAWTSYDKAIRTFDMSRGECLANNNKKGGRFHPTQKPVKLYGWLINKYCKEDFKVLDTHLGSGSIAIACHKYKIDLVGCEIDTDYFNEAKRRLETEQAQQSLF